VDKKKLDDLVTTLKGLLWIVVLGGGVILAGQAYDMADQSAVRRFLGHSKASSLSGRVHTRFLFPNLALERASNEVQRCYTRP
jgi:hypothetical protein